MTQKERTVPKSARIVLIYVLAILLEFTIVNAYLASTITISSGIYPAAATYTVWAEPPIYYAKDIWGRTVFSSTNCTYVVKGCLDAMISGATLGSSMYFGIMHFAKGLFEFDTQVLMIREVGQGIKEGLIIEGEGRYTTILKAIGAHPVFNFTSEHRDDRFESFTFRSLEITSDAAARSAGNHALIFQNATFVNIYDCYFENNYDSAIYMEDLETNFIHDNGIYSSNGNGIEIDAASDVHITSNNIFYNELDGIRITNSVYDEISGNLIGYSSNNGIFLTGCSKSTISNNPSIIANQWDGIRITDSENLTITGNNVYSNGLAGGGLGDGIRLGNSNFTVVSSNRVFDDSATPIQRFGIREEGASDYNIIIGCNTVGCVMDADQCGISILTAEGSSHSRVVSSYNGTTWVDTWGTG